MPADTITLASTSRYRGTRLFQGAVSAVLEFGVYKPPEQFDTPRGDETTHVVTQDEVGFLDAIAAREYGVEYESVGWVFSRMNGIVDPETDMYPGQVLLVPSIDLVRQYAQS